MQIDEDSLRNIINSIIKLDVEIACAPCALLTKNAALDKNYEMDPLIFYITKKKLRIFLAEGNTIRNKSKEEWV